MHFGHYSIKKLQSLKIENKFNIKLFRVQKDSESDDFWQSLANKIVWHYF